ncbi:MAG: hypothetical protein ACYC3I_06295 [Gemmataceae bacterium]
MWTPKRIILLACGFVLFTLVYLLYSLTFLGRINTLPPLPEEYHPGEGGEASSGARESRPIKPTPLQRKLEMAFNRGCEELRWPVQLEMNSKSMVIAAWKFELADRGRIKLELMSLALFGKKKNDGREIEINTLKCKQAYITFDKPIAEITPSELSGRKVIEAELFGEGNKPIEITNNRRTAVREDDLLVQIPNGPLYYYEKTHLVKTSDHVHLIDGSDVERGGRLIPRKADIRAEGMEMELATTAPPPRPGFLVPAKPKNESITGVKRIVLKEAVRMNLCVAGGGPFPNNDKASSAASAGKAPVAPKASASPAAAMPTTPAPSLVVIETPGRFVYELFKDHDLARFDVPVNSDHPSSPQDVTVTRINENASQDMLVCKHLELRLKRRNNEAPPANAAAPARTDDEGLEIETAHATGPDVTLTSDAEKLDAHCTEFMHDATKKLTILKGVPYMEANKEDSLIQAPELRIQDILVPVPPSAAAGDGGKATNTPPKTYQQIEASGPGSIHMTNKSTGKQNVHAHWNEKLLSTHDFAQNLDKLILTGAARFVDDEHEQSLKAEQLNVWLLTEDKKAEAMPKVVAVKAEPSGTAKASAGPTASRRPHHVEALRNVLAHSPELNIHDAARLVINFRDVPPERMPPPSSRGDKLGTAPPEKKSASGDNNRSLTVAAPKESESEPRPSGSGDNNRSLTVAAPKESESEPRPSGSGDNNHSLTVVAPNRATPETRPGNEPQRPIDLSARSIEAKVLRCGERMALDNLWAEGGSLDVLDKRSGVVVRQEPAKPGEEGVFIQGNTLKMNCTAEGNVLLVTGDLAQLKMDKILIIGPEVNIDQVANKAWVVGGGAMQMQSTTTLEGKPLARPVPLTVHWSDNMLFAGTFADFYGSIQAEQDNARLACQHLQVIFDHPISLKEGMSGSQPAKVSHLAGDKGASDQNVRVEDQTFEGDKLQKYQLLMGKEIHMSTVPRDEEGPPQNGKSNDANVVTLYGPGNLRILQRGGAEVVPTPGKPESSHPASATTPEKEQEMKLTYVNFENLMKASSLTNVASFWGSVRVLNLPCDDPHRDIDLDEILSAILPEGALFLRSNQLRVGTYQKPVFLGPDQKQLRTYQVMDAHGQVYVQGRDFTAQCDHMTFNEEKDQVIFIGEGDNLAILSKGDIKGQKLKTFRAKKIFYYRSRGKVDVTELNSFDG